MCELEPAFVAVPNPLVVTLVFEGLSKGDKYLEEDLVWNTTDCRPRRQLMTVRAVMTVGK